MRLSHLGIPDLETENEWHTDGPILPIDFSRLSARKRLTRILAVVRLYRQMVPSILPTA